MRVLKSLNTNYLREKLLKSFGPVFTKGTYELKMQPVDTVKSRAELWEEGETLAQKIAELRGTGKMGRSWGGLKS